MKNLLYIFAIFFPILVFGQTLTENYVKTTSFKSPVALANVFNVTPDDKIEQITYYDGLGKTIQTVSAKAGGDKQNIIQHIEYDEFGKTPKQYLPYATLNEVSNDDYLNFNAQNQLKTNIESFYNSSKYEYTVNPFSEISFEASPLNRPLEQGAPGVAWQVDPESDNDHTIKFDYSSNSEADAVKLFRVGFSNNNQEAPYLYFDGYYPANNVYKNITKDENWSPASNNDFTVEEYKNKQGQVILKRTYNNGIKHDTQYVYDDFGNLTFVITPEAFNGAYDAGTVTVDGKQILFDNYQKPALIDNGSIQFDLSHGVLTTTVNLIVGGGYGPTLKTGNIVELPFAIPNVIIGTINGDNGTYSLEINNGWLVITGEGGSINNTATLFNSNLIQSSNFDTALLDNLCYQYKYDHRNRLIEKKIPQKGWEYIVYDNLDRPVLTQDALQRQNNEWLFTKYDAFNRVIYTGKVEPSGCMTTACTRAFMQAEVDAQATFNESKSTTVNAIGGTDVYYSNNVYPTTNIETLTVNYYDDYNFDWNYNGGLTINPTSSLVWNPENQQPLAINFKGLSTGSKIKVLETNDWIVGYTSYDAKGRPIYAASYNSYLGTTDKVATVLDFVGNAKKVIAIHSKGGNTITIEDQFTYDHQNRLKKHLQKVNNEPFELIAENHYDELGQLTQKDVGGLASATNALQNIDYKYNIRGWLTDINDVNAITNNKLFNFKINYTQVNTQPNSNAVPLYNGNIAETLWKTSNVDEDNIKGYNYEYDALNRLMDAVFYEPNNGSTPNGDLRYEEQITGYDKNGNIKGIFRTGDINTEGFVTIWDNINYTYQGNQLQTVTESNATSAISDYTPTLEEGFIDRNTTGSDYQYDLNGNMIQDTNKGITNITYNYLNLPTQVFIDTEQTTTGTTGGTTVFQDDFSDGTVAPWQAYPGMNAPTIQSQTLRVQLEKGVDFPGAYIQEDLISGHAHTISFTISNLGATEQIKLDIRRNIGTPEHEYIIHSNGTHTYTFITNDDGNHYINFQTNNRGSGTYFFNMDDFLLVDDDTGSGGGTTTTGENGIISYIYTATGIKLQKTVQNNTDNTTSVTQYAGDKIYEQQPSDTSPVLKMMFQPEGYIEPQGSSFTYAYQYKDHLGNIRLTYADSDGNGTISSSEIISEKHFYPFGLQLKGFNTDVSPNSNSMAEKFAFNGKENNPELGLKWYDFGARNYEASLGRWMNIDPLAEKYLNYSTYNYTLNNPIVYVDPDGARVEFADNLSNEDRELIGSAIHWLRKNSKTFDKAFGELHSSEMIFKVGKSDGSWGLFFRPSPEIEEKIVDEYEDENGDIQEISEMSLRHNMDSGADGGNITVNLDMFRELQLEGLNIDPLEEAKKVFPEEFAGAALFLYYFTKSDGYQEGTPGAANTEFETKMLSGIIMNESNLGYGRSESQIFAESFGVKYLKEDMSQTNYFNALNKWQNMTRSKHYKNLSKNNVGPEYTDNLKK